jgi:hypothetical protein
MATCSVIYRIEIEPSDSVELARRIDAGLVPMLETTPRFHSHRWFDLGTGVCLSLSCFRDEDDAADARARIDRWLAGNLNFPVRRVPGALLGRVHPPKPFVACVPAPEPAERDRSGISRR